MIRKSSKELLFERMEAVNPDFKRPLPSGEQEIVNDILSLNEGIDSILNKIKEYGKRGLLTTAILLAVALGANAQEDEYMQIMKVGRNFEQSNRNSPPKIDSDSNNVYDIGVPGRESQMTNSDFDIKDVNYFYLSLAVQDLNRIAPNYSKKPPTTDAYGDIVVDKSNWDADNAYDIAMDLYNILQSNKSNSYYDKMNSMMYSNLMAAGGVRSSSGTLIFPNNGVGRIKAYIQNGKNIKLVDGKFVGGLNWKETPTPAQ